MDGAWLYGTEEDCVSAIVPQTKKAAQEDNTRAVFIEGKKPERHKKYSSSKTPFEGLQTNQQLRGIVKQMLVFQGPAAAGRATKQSLKKLGFRKEKNHLQHKRQRSLRDDIGAPRSRGGGRCLSRAACHPSPSRPPQGSLARQRPGGSQPASPPSAAAHCYTGRLSRSAAAAPGSWTGAPPGWACPAPGPARSPPASSRPTAS